MSDFVDFLHEAQVFQTGQFRLKSGKESPYFMNFGRIDEGTNLAKMGHYFAQALARLEVDLLFGPAYKGLPMAVATVVEYARFVGRDLPYCSFRKESKQHGETGMVLGRAPTAQSRIVIIDDVLTTSATKLEAIEELRLYLGAPPRIVAVLVGVDRLERTAKGELCSADFTATTGIPVVALSDTRKVVDTLMERGKIPAEIHRQCLETLSR